ncbi:hypothetical protein BASA50_008388 [Batrachochytrium salamandrivorans]|uniref:Uncharacterized protein n=1 Tax=Batrachochytrium salamandrivorans TaxID=1357716 RepID=A0ABQ8F7M3_9FUNG|nr:hypothetical protein BASA50_008388 [Batrachochytrium salamandrivorans]
MPKPLQDNPLSARQHALAPPSSQNCSTQSTPSSDPNPSNPKQSDPLSPQDPDPCGTQIESQCASQTKNQPPYPTNLVQPSTTTVPKIISPLDSLGLADLVPLKQSDSASIPTPPVYLLDTRRTPRRMRYSHCQAAFEAPPPLSYISEEEEKEDVVEENLESRISSRLFRIVRQKPGPNDNIMISISPVHRRLAEIIPLRECDDDDDDDGVDTIQTLYIFPDPIVNLGPTSDRRGIRTQPTPTPVGTLIGAMRAPIWPSPIDHPLFNACTIPKAMPIDMSLLEITPFLEPEPPAITTHLPKRIYHAVSSWILDRFGRSLDDPYLRTIESFTMIQSRSIPTMVFTTPPDAPEFLSIEQRVRSRRILKLRSNAGVGSKMNRPVQRRPPPPPPLVGKSPAFLRSADSTLATTTRPLTPVDSVDVDCSRVIAADPTKDGETEEIEETEETEETEGVVPASTSRSSWSILRRFRVSTQPVAKVNNTLASTMMDGAYSRQCNITISDRERRRLARLENSLDGDYDSINQEWLSMMGEPTYFIHKRSLEPHPRTVTFNHNVTAMPFFKANGVSHLLEIHPGDETDIEDGLRYLEYDRAHGVSSESHASLEVKKLPAGAVAISSVAAPLDQPIHLEELAQLHSDEQQSQAVVGPVLDEPPCRMSVAERVRSYEAKTVSNAGNVGHCASTHIHTCCSVSTEAAIVTKIPLVYPTVVTPVAAVKTPILSDTPAPVEKESPSGDTPKQTFLRMLSCDTWSRFGQSSVSTHSLPQESNIIQPILHLGLEATDMSDMTDMLPTMASTTTQELPELESLPDLHPPQPLSHSSKFKSIFKFRFRLGRRNTTSVSNTGLNELRDSTNTVDSGYNSNRSSISSAFDATKLWFKTNMGKKSNVVGATSPPATPLASVDIVSPETLPTGAQDTVVL